MTRALVVLAAVLAACVPLQQVAAGTLCDCACLSMAAASQASGAASSDGCCILSESRDEDSGSDAPADDEPASGCDCSVVCCTPVKVTASVPPRPDHASHHGEATVLVPAGSDLHAPAHLHRLKRPPRPANTV